MLLVDFLVSHFGIYKFDISGLVHIWNTALNVLFFEAKYLILCDLSTEIDYFIIMWTKESVIVLGVTEAIHLDVNRVVGVPVICIMVV